MAYSKCGAKASIAAGSSIGRIVCDRAPHNGTERHSASIALLVSPTLDFSRQDKWITGNITWKDM